MFKKLFLVLFVSFIYIESALANLDVKARTAILQDYYSGEILYEKESKQKKSSTKLKTKSRLQPPMEVDLHIHQLVKSTKGMQNHDILNLQLDDGMDSGIYLHFQ